jgi:VWFA-related protein
MDRLPAGAKAVAAAILLVGQAAVAQDQPPRFRTEVEVTSVDAIVVDDRGQPILNLRPADFDVKVDGVSRRVVSADWIPLTAEAAARAGRPAVPPPPEGYSSNQSATLGRLFVLVVDRINIRFGGMTTHRPAINAFIDQLQPTDRIAVVAGGLGTSGSIPFTIDHERAKAAVSTLVGQRGLPGAGIAELLREVLTALKGVDAPKTVVLISEGFPLNDTPVLGDRRPFLVELEHLAAEARTIVYALKLDERITDMRWSNQDPTLGPDLTEPPAGDRRGAARSQGPGDIGGPREMPGAANAPVPDRVEAGSGLYSVAAVTGGAMFTAVMTADSAFARIEGELAGYYLLGVDTDPKQKDGKAHAITVGVNRPGATARARRQVIVARGETRPRTPEQAVQSALGSPVTISALPIRATAVSTRNPSGSNVRVAIRAVIGDDYSAPRPVVLGYVVTDANGRIVNRLGGNSTLRPMTAERPSPLQLTTSFEVAPGEYVLKLAVADGDRVGSIEHPFHAER